MFYVYIGTNIIYKIIFIFRPVNVYIVAYAQYIICIIILYIILYYIHIHTSHTCGGIYEKTAFAVFVVTAVYNIVVHSWTDDVYYNILLNNSVARIHEIRRRVLVFSCLYIILYFKVRFVLVYKKKKKITFKNTKDNSRNISRPMFWYGYVHFVCSFVVLTLRELLLPQRI